MCVTFLDYPFYSSCFSHSVKHGACLRLLALTPSRGNHRLPNEVVNPRGLRGRFIGDLIRYAALRACCRYCKWNDTLTPSPFPMEKGRLAFGHPACLCPAVGPGPCYWMTSFMRAHFRSLRDRAGPPKGGPYMASLTYNRRY